MNVIKAIVDLQDDEMLNYLQEEIEMKGSRYKKELVMVKDNHDGMTALHIACRFHASIEVVSELIEIGGKD